MGLFWDIPMLFQELLQWVCFKKPPWKRYLLPGYSFCAWANPGTGHPTFINWLSRVRFYILPNENSKV